MSKWNAGYYIKEGFRSIFTHGLMSFAAVCMIVACLLIMGSFSLVAVNLDNMLGELEKDNEFLAYVDETLSDEAAAALQNTLEGVPNVASATFVTRGEARETFEASKDRDLFKDLPDNVFRHRYRIHVVDIEQMESTVRAVEHASGIDGISAAIDVAKGFVTVRNIATAVSYILIAILMIISLFIIANTIKLATFYRREEIAIMKMCGATNSFIRWPFVVEGMVLGLLGAALAFFLQWGIYALIGNAVASSGEIALITLVPFEKLALWLLGVFCGAGFVIGVGGSVLAIRKFLQV